MKKTIFVLITMIVVGVGSKPALTYASQTPQLFTYEGRYVSPDGTPMPDGVYDLVFSLYEAQTGGSAVWTETHRRADGDGVQVIQGNFKVALGKNIPLPNFSTNYWLAVLDPRSGKELVPREELGSVPYALAIAPSVDLPVGSIIAWHKSLVGTPQELPYKWVECNGQVLSDSESLYDGQAIPDLNNEGRFLRGSLTSGVIQEDALQQHGHSTNAINTEHSRDAVAGGNRSTTDRHGAYVGNVTGARVADETRPKNMSIVWIMKVK